MPPPVPTGTAPQNPQAVLVQQKQVSAIMIWAIGAFCIFGWEWFLCLTQEYKRIWTKSMNHLNLLYIANRYFGLLQLIFVVTLLANIWTPKACDHVYLWEPVGALISTVLSQMILGSRVYSIFFQNKVVAFVLATTLIAEVVIGGYAISTTSPPPLSPAGTGPTCATVMGPFGWLIAFWAIPLFYYTITFILTAWKAYRNLIEEVNATLYNIIWRDGLPYFFFIFIMNFVNVIIIATVPETLRAVNLTPTIVLGIVLSCRLVLAGENSGSKANPGIHPWSNDSDRKSDEK